MPRFDVFVSYSRADQDAVERLGRALRARGLTVFVDRWYLVAGQSWPETLEQHLRDCRAVAVCIGASGLGAWQQREHYKALDRQAHEPGFPVIPVLLPGVVDPALGFLGLNTWVDLRQGLEDGVSIEILARAVRGLPPGDDAALAPDPRAAICPYRGLLPFREEDASFFVGREDFTATLIAKVRRSSLVAVVGASGSGKSSVVRAGLVPALRRDANNHVWDVLTLTPGPTPLHALLAALSPPPEEMSRAARLARIEGDVVLLREHGLTIDAFTRDIISEQPGTDRLLLVVDQWEELYTQAKSMDDRQRFLDMILQATADGSATVVLTLRGDFYGRALEDRVLADRLQNAVVNLGPMRREELKRAVTEPAAQVGLGFEDGLVDRILEDVGSEPGTLPLLEFLLTELWARRERGLLTHSAYAAIGGVRGAIATRAEAELEKLTPEQREALRRVMIRLVTPGEGQADMRTRAQVPPDAAADAIRLFADARLLTTGFDEATGHETLEVSHEALIREWKTYRGWVDADREFLRTVERVKDAMHAWAEEEADKDSRLLAPGRPLEEARELLSRPHAMIDDIRPLIEASIAHDDARLAEEQRRIEAEKQREIEQARKVAAAERGRRRAAVAGFLAALVLAIAAGWFGWSAEQAKDRVQLANDSAQAELRKSQEGESHLLANLSRQTTARGDAIEGMSLALQGLPRDLDRPDRPLVNETVLALVTALQSPYYTAKILRGHEAVIKSAAFSPDGRTLVTASMDGTARLWDTATGKETLVLRGHEGIVTSAVYSSDGRIVVTASDDKTARIWDVATGREIAVLRGHKDAVQLAVFSPDGGSVVTTSYNDADTLGTVENAARVWDAATGKEVAIMRGHDTVISSAAFSPDGKIVVTASLDRTARLWEAETGREIAILRHEAPVATTAFSPDGKTVLTAPYDKPAQLWDAATGKEMGVLRGHDGPIHFATFSPDGKMVVTASLDMTGRLWDTATGKSLATLRGHEELINSVAFNPEATIVATASMDETARLWDTGTGREISVLRGHHGGITAASFSPDGKTVATGSGDRTVRLWTASGWQEISTLRGHTLPINFVDFSPDGKMIATASLDGTAGLWELVTNKVLDLRGHRTFVFSAVFSPDGGTVVTASEDQTARLWDTATGEETVILRGHDQRVGWATFSPDGRIVVTASHDGTGRLWESASGRQTAILRGHKGVVFFADFSPDGRAVVTSSYDKTARLWDAETGKEIAVLEGHQDRLAGADFSPDGRTVVTASNDKTARLWDAETGKEIAVLEGHQDRLTGADFSPDGRTVVTASDDKTARLWDVATGKIIFVLRGHEDRITRTRVSPDGRIVATASADKTVRLWDAATGQEIMTLRGHEANAHAVAFSPDSKTLGTASAGHTARVWRTERPSLGELISEACQRLARIDQAPQHCQSAALHTGASSVVYSTRAGNELGLLQVGCRVPVQSVGRSLCLPLLQNGA
jgi:WD40 repeat protein